MFQSQAKACLLVSLSAFVWCGGLSPVAAQAVPVGMIVQEGGASASATTNDSGPSGIIPVQKGFNASLGTTSQHDSTNGWSSVLTPNLAYRLNKYFSADVEAPIYTYINVYLNKGTAAKPSFVYTPEHFAAGDTGLSFHGEANPLSLDYNGTFTLGLPSGNTTYGLGAGQVTYNINNHIEKSFGIVAPDVEIGIGDATSLVNQRVVRSYIAVGPLAHFQAGVSVSLPRGLSFSADAYEELPLSNDKVYSTTGKGKKKVTTVTSTGPAEDNGFITSLDIPLTRHVTLSGFYDRSLRQHEDVGGFSFTFLLRPRPVAAGGPH